MSPQGVPDPDFFEFLVIFLRFVLHHHGMKSFQNLPVVGKIADQGDPCLFLEGDEVEDGVMGLYA